MENELKVFAANEIRLEIDRDFKSIFLSPNESVIELGDSFIFSIPSLRFTADIEANFNTEFDLSVIGSKFQFKARGVVMIAKSKNGDKNVFMCKIADYKTLKSNVEKIAASIISQERHRTHF